MSMYATFWSLIPPLIAIILALITKEVYSSLFIGILVGGLFYANFGFEGAWCIFLRTAWWVSSPIPTMWEYWCFW